MTNALLFEGSDLEDVLSEAQLVFGPEVDIVAANRVRKGGVYGFFAREWYEVWARGPAAIENPALAMLDRSEVESDVDSFQSMVTQAIAAQTSGGEFDDAMDRFFSDESDSAAPAPAAVATTAPRVAGGVAVAERPTIILEDSGTEPVLAVPTTPAAVALEDAPRGTSIFDEPRAPQTDLVWAVLDRIEALATVTALPETGVVAFVGDASVALPLVRELGARLGLWSGEIAVVSRRELDEVPAWLAVTDLEDLAARAGRWRRREGVVPVIIDNVLDKPHFDWVEQVVDTLGPVETRLVAEAWRLPEQVGRVALRLGGVDGLELAQAGETIDPLALLDLDIPIGSVEGRPATPELLTAVWLDRRRRG